MDTLGKTNRERLHIREILIKKFGTLEAAAEKMQLSKFTLSRVINGSAAEMTTLIKILKATGHLKQKAYKMPAEDLLTFYFLNGILPADLLGNELKGDHK